MEVVTAFTTIGGLGVNGITYLTVLEEVLPLEEVVLRWLQPAHTCHSGSLAPYCWSLSSETSPLHQLDGNKRSFQRVNRIAQPLRSRRRAKPCCS
jgi:hypothetical protein